MKPFSLYQRVAIGVILLLFVSGAIERLLDGTSLLYSIPNPSVDLTGFLLVVAVLAVVVVLLFRAIDYALSRPDRNGSKAEVCATSLLRIHQSVKSKPRNTFCRWR